MKLYFQCVIIAAVLITAWVTTATAALQCNGCHGTSNPVDYRPLDSIFRNPSTGGFSGNHRTHLDSPASSTACSICHPGSSSFTSSHRDGRIKISSRINNSPNTTYYPAYNNNTSAWSQTAIPAMGACANVNCHFETISPVWASAPELTTCSTCHGAPPSGTASAYSGGAAGSHAKHNQYYPGTSNCKKCHPDNATFAHATSAGNRDLKISFAAAPNNGSGSYSGPLNDYLPSRNNVFGNCTATYCHSPGTKATSYNAPKLTATWGGTLGCGGCHEAAPVTGSHRTHLDPAYSYGVPVACYKCHAATVTPGMTISTTMNHLDKLVNVAFDSTTTAVFGKYSGRLSPMQKNPGSGYANCENVYCHSSGQGAGGSWPPTYSTPKWGVSATGKCGTCHGDGYHGALNKMLSGSHDKHMSYGFAGSITGCGICHYGAGFATNSCTQCHYGSDTNLTDLHINHKVDVSFLTKYGGTYGGTPEPGDGYGSCSSVYCHSDGTSLATGSVPLNTSTVWGSGVLSCGSCHGNPPAYGNGSPKANSHTRHNFGCHICHSATTSDGIAISSTLKHVNQAYDLSPGVGVTFTYVFAITGGTCSNISCHNNCTAVWGTVLTCVDCHAVSPGGD